MQLALFVSALVATSSLASHAVAEECDLKSVTSVRKKIAALPQVDACGSASGFSLNPPLGLPNADQLSKICTEASCVESISAIVALDLPSCTLALLNNINIRDIVAQIQSGCETQSAAVDSANQAGSPILRAVTPSVASNPAVES